MIGVAESTRATRAPAPGDPLDGTHILACQRVPVEKVIELLPVHYLESLEQNQKIASCCRHPENHEVEARYSSPKQARTGVPDIYIFYCMEVHDNGPGNRTWRQHIRPCLGVGDVRPKWDVR